MARALYTVARDNFLKAGKISLQLVLKDVLPSYKDACHFHSKIEQKVMPGLSVEELLEGAKECAIKRDGDGAVCHYTTALKIWGECAIAIGAWHDALAAAHCWMRVAPGPGPHILATEVYLLFGEVGLAAKALPPQSVEGASPMHKALRDNYSVITGGITFDEIVNSGPMYCIADSSWHVDTFNAGHMGRGLRTSEPVKAGQALLMQHRLMRQQEEDTEWMNEKESAKNRRIASQASLKRAVIERSVDDTILTTCIRRMTDGSRLPPLMHISMLPNRLDPVVPLLLPALPEFMGLACCSKDTPEYAALDDKSTSRYLAVNCVVEPPPFGSCRTMKQYAKKVDEAREAPVSERAPFNNLFTCISLINHRREENCMLIPGPKGSETLCVVAKRDMRAGEQLFMCYDSSVNDKCKGWAHV